MGNHQTALEFANRLVDLDPTSADSYYLKARVLRKFQQFDQVLANLKEAVRFEPTNSLMLTEVGIVLLQLHRFSEAKKEFQTAIDCDAENVLAYLNLAVACQYLDQKNEARDLLSLGRRRFPNDPRIGKFLQELNDK